MLKPALLLFTAIALVGCAAETGDDSEPEGTGESQDHLLSGPRLTPAQVASELRRAGFPESSVGKMV